MSTNIKQHSQTGALTVSNMSESQTQSYWNNNSIRAWMAAAEVLTPAAAKAILSEESSARKAIVFSAGAGFNTLFQKKQQVFFPLSLVNYHKINSAFYASQLAGRKNLNKNTVLKYEDLLSFHSALATNSNIQSTRNINNQARCFHEEKIRYYEQGKVSAFMWDNPLGPYLEKIQFHTQAEQYYAALANSPQHVV